MHIYVDSITNGIARILVGSEESYLLEVPVSLFDVDLKPEFWYHVSLSEDGAMRDERIQSIRAIMEKLGDNP